MKQCPAAVGRAAAGLRAFSLMLCLGACLLAACVHKPTLQLHHAQISSVGLVGVGLDVVVQVNNSNSFDVQVRDVNATVTLAGRYPLAPIRMNPNKWLPAGETTLVSVPVIIPWAALPGILSETIGKSTISYRVQGTADVTATRLLAVERNNEPLDEQGEIPRAQILAAARPRLPNIY